MKKIVALSLLALSVNGYSYQYSQDYSNVGNEIQDRYQQQQLIDQQQKIAEDTRRMREEQEAERERQMFNNSFNH